MSQQQGDATDPLGAHIPSSSGKWVNDNLMKKKNDRDREKERRTRQSKMWNIHLI